jgi:hypothetical protein
MGNKFTLILILKNKLGSEILNEFGINILTIFSTDF